MSKTDGGRSCTARNCSSNSVECKSLRFFSFPVKDEERCKQWLVNCKRLDLLSQNAEYIFKNCFICSKHFENSEFVNFFKIFLKPQAVPTIFETPEPRKKSTNKSNPPPKDTETQKKPINKSKPAPKNTEAQKKPTNKSKPAPKNTETQKKPTNKGNPPPKNTEAHKKKPTNKSNPPPKDAETQKKPTNKTNPPPKDTEPLKESIEVLSNVNSPVEEILMEDTDGSSSANQLIISSIESQTEQTEDSATYYLQTTETNSETPTNYSNLVYQLIVDPSQHTDGGVIAVLDGDTLTNSALVEILLDSTNVKTVEELQSTNVEPVEVIPSTSILEQNIDLIDNVDDRTPSGESLQSHCLLKTLLASDHSSDAQTVCVLNTNDNGQNQVLKSILKPIGPPNSANNVNRDHDYLFLKASTPKGDSIKSIKSYTAPRRNLGAESKVVNSLSPIKELLNVPLSSVKEQSSPAVISSPSNPTVSESPNEVQDESMTFLKLISSFQFKSTVPISPANASVKTVKKGIESPRMKRSKAKNEVRKPRVGIEQFKLLCEEFLPPDVAHFIRTKVRIKRRPLSKLDKQNTSIEEMKCQSKDNENHCLDKVNGESESNKTEAHNDENVSSVQAESIGISDEPETNLEQLIEKYKDNTLSKYFCDMCAFETDKKFFLNRHKYNQHATDRPYKCDHCNYRAKSQHILRSHMEMHSAQVYKCNFCEKSYRLQSSYNNHVVRVHKQRKKVNSCHLCAYQTGFVTYLKKHLTEKHQIEGEDLNLYVTKKCPYCECRLKNDAVFDDHLAVQHQVDRDGNPAAPDKFKCKRCEFSCMARFQLSNHCHARHARKFTCEICDYTALDKGRLDSHIKFRHLGIKSFICEACGCQLASRRSLKSHMLLRHKPKENHVCTVCSKSFYWSQYLRTHMRQMHSDKEVRRHDCPHCEYSAKLKGNLTRHLRRKHKSEQLIVLSLI